MSDANNNRQTEMAALVHLHQHSLSRLETAVERIANSVGTMQEQLAATHQVAQSAHKRLDEMGPSTREEMAKLHREIQALTAAQEKQSKLLVRGGTVLTGIIALIGYLSSSFELTPKAGKAATTHGQEAPQRQP